MSRGARVALLLLAGLGSGPAVFSEERATILFALPSVPAPSDEALADARRILERLAGMPSGSIALEVAAEPGVAREALARRPDLALLALPLYLDLVREGVPVRVLRTPERAGSTRERFHVAVAVGSPARGLGDLALGKLTGTALWDERFVRSVVLGGGAAEAALVPARRALDGIRAVREGRADAVLLSEPEYDALEGLLAEGEVRTVFMSQELPLPPLVGFARTPGPLEARLVAALDKLCTDPDGSLLCEAFDVQAFAAADTGAYRPSLAP